MVAQLTGADFEPHIGTDFDVAEASVPLALQLLEVRLLGTALRSGGAFALTFRGPPTEPLQQATYPLVHPRLGRLDIFIVPIARQTDGMRYEAVFT
ncbi:DUF6916 family protein [Mesorhizobium amorphae]|uniref:DUF6916 family protein n=1 Tax=Mesorhizobium amorphae TaxID=71433 RepID=UPI001183E6D8|nr:hypothetical protein [Mesorhizobium amorphae]